MLNQLFGCGPFHRISTLLMGLILLGSTGCENSQGKQAAPPRVPEVGIVNIQPRPLVLTTELPGRTAAYRVAEIRPQVNGIIQKRLFEEGSKVEAGQVLYRIEPAPFQAALDSARASLEKARASVPTLRSKANRYKELLTQKAVSQQDYDDAAAALDQALAEIDYWKANIDQAEINLRYTEVKAPISGKISRSSVTDGALVTAYQALPLATIQQLDPIYVDVAQSTADFLNLRRCLEAGLICENEAARDKVRIILEDGTPYPLEGRLQFRDVTSVDPATGCYILRIVVPNPDELLLPAMYVRAVISEGTAPDAILAPQEGVGRTPKGEPVAWIVDGDNIVRQRPLQLDRAIGDEWLITSGLSAGDRLIVEGRLHVRPGDTVQSVTVDTAEPAGPGAGR